MKYALEGTGFGARARPYTCIDVHAAQEHEQAAEALVAIAKDKLSSNEGEAASRRSVLKRQKSLLRLSRTAQR